MLTECVLKLTLSLAISIRDILIILKL